MPPLAPQGETKEEEKSFRCWFLEAKGETSQEMGEKQFPFLEEEGGGNVHQTPTAAAPLCHCK